MFYVTLPLKGEDEKLTTKSRVEKYKGKCHHSAFKNRVLPSTKHAHAKKKCLKNSSKENHKGEDEKLTTKSRVEKYKGKYHHSAFKNRVLPSTKHAHAKKKSLKKSFRKNDKECEGEKRMKKKHAYEDQATKKGIGMAFFQRVISVFRRNQQSSKGNEEILHLSSRMAVPQSKMDVSGFNNGLRDRMQQSRAAKCDSYQSVMKEMKGKGEKRLASEISVVTPVFEKGATLTLDELQTEIGHTPRRLRTVWLDTKYMDTGSPATESNILDTNQKLQDEIATLQREMEKMKHENFMLKQDMETMRDENLVLKWDMETMRHENLMLKQDMETMQYKNLMLKQNMDRRQWKDKQKVSATIPQMERQTTSLKEMREELLRNVSQIGC
ncbi:uncharacterized protein LOC132542177 [Erinaceus europaeus]|uniref:Uncharacterized protein LOC132542177 n=1 Tax=Erinaceus europaeus TaxID=9365 RepID=A0ABM3YIK9_ERIEU|nr:uncharacterized protein LOC132542177 [Erinaceus europaeus]